MWRRIAYSHIRFHENLSAGLWNEEEHGKRTKKEGRFLSLRFSF
jgi:hypothetical protein